MVDALTTMEEVPLLPIRVLVVDDHPAIREGLRTMLETPGIEVVGEAGTGEDAARLAGALDPDVVLMDVRMPDMDGLSATRLIKTAHPQMSVFVVTSFSSADYLERAIRAGASGFLLKGMTRATLLNSVRLIRDGGSVFEADLLRSALDGIAYDAGAAEAVRALSDRERDVLRLLVDGQTNKEIADALGYSVGTIKNSIQAMMETLGVSDRTQAAVLAVRGGILPAGDEAPIPLEDVASEGAR